MYMCVVYLNYRYCVKVAGEMLSMWYFGTLYAVIYSLNLDLANKCAFANVKAGNVYTPSHLHLIQMLYSPIHKMPGLKHLPHKLILSGL